MKAYELIKETFLRKRFICLMHISWFAIYGLLFLLPFPPEAWQAWPWGPMLFGWSGCFLPLLLSAGIFGDDIASGRISFLITKPLWPGELYIYRLIGLSLQALVHLIIAGSIILILQSVTGRGNVENLDQWVTEFEDVGLIRNRGNIENLGLWILAAWLIFNTWAALSTTLSTVVKRAHNSMLIFAAAGFIYFLTTFLMMALPKHTCTVVLLRVLKYSCPPVSLLSKLADGRYNLVQSAGCVLHTLALTAFYGVIGIIILSKREFKFVRD